jgi:hypothetical protein
MVQFRLFEIEFIPFTMGTPYQAARLHRVLELSEDPTSLIKFAFQVVEIGPAL